jgi:glycyl-tRNA synthetase beta chain
MNYLFEIGTEEIPARFLQVLTNDFIRIIKNKLENIQYKKIQSFATYRRIAFIIYDIAQEQSSTEEELKGPPEIIAFDDFQNYTRAGQGFLKKMKAEKGYLKDGYLYVKKIKEAKQTKDVLGPIILDALHSLYLPVSMKWGLCSQKFYRPVHWMVSLLDDQILEIDFAEKKASNLSRTKRSFESGKDINGDLLKIDNAKNYEKIMENNEVLVCYNKRKEFILNELLNFSDANQIDEDLLAEVCGLCENPTILQGTFDKEFLDIPEKILITTMGNHQKYFPVYEGIKLTNKFLLIAENCNKDNKKNIIEGNQRVLRARLYDAKFYYEEDINHDFDFFLEKLKNITFQQKLGTVYDKVERNIALSKIIAQRIKIENIDKIIEIATFSKADLATAMVYEFSDLQGYIGQQYALKWGMENEIAEGLYEHYLPAFSGDKLPKSIYSSVVSVADKMDNIVGQFIVGNIPSGSQDPFALRRQANGIVRIFYETNFFDFSLIYLIEKSLALYNNVNSTEEIKVKLIDFFEQRIEQYLKEKNLNIELIKTVKNLDIKLLKDRLSFIQLLLNNENIKLILENINRVSNITKSIVSINNEVNPSLFEDDSEKKLFQTFNSILLISNQWDKDLIKQWFIFVEAITNFFDSVMVMSDNENVKNNRITLLLSIKLYFEKFGDFKNLKI